MGLKKNKLKNHGQNKKSIFIWWNIFQQSHRNRVAWSNQQLTWSCWQRFQAIFCYEFELRCTATSWIHTTVQRVHGLVSQGLAQLLAVLLGSGEGVPDVANESQKSEASHLKGLVYIYICIYIYEIIYIISIINMFKHIYLTSPQRPTPKKHKSTGESPKKLGWNTDLNWWSGSLGGPLPWSWTTRLLGIKKQRWLRLKGLYTGIPAEV